MSRSKGGTSSPRATRRTSSESWPNRPAARPRPSPATARPPAAIRTAPRSGRASVTSAARPTRGTASPRRPSLAPWPSTADTPEPGPRAGGASAARGDARGCALPRTCGPPSSTPTRTSPAWRSTRRRPAQVRRAARASWPWRRRRRRAIPVLAWDALASWGAAHRGRRLDEPGAGRAGEVGAARRVDIEAPRRGLRGGRRRSPRRARWRQPWSTCVRAALAGGAGPDQLGSADRRGDRAPRMKRRR